VNATLIPAQEPGGVLGATYTFTETTVGNGVHWYRLEVVETGDTQSSEPIQVTHRGNRAYLPLTLRAG
jgi:hypothetical protein